MLEDQIKLGILFNHRNDLAADLLGEHHHLDVLVVFEAIADDWSLVVGDRKNGEQLRLRSRFQAEMIRPPELENLLHHLALLIDLDRIDANVFAAVAVFGNRVLKCLVELAQAMLQNIRKANQDRQRNTAQLQLLNQFLEIDFALRLLGRDEPTGARSHRRRNNLCPSSLRRKVHWRPR